MSFPTTELSKSPVDDCACANNVKKISQNEDKNVYTQ